MMACTHAHHVGAALKASTDSSGMDKSLTELHHNTNRLSAPAAQTATLAMQQQSRQHSSPKITVNEGSGKAAAVRGWWM